MGALFNQFGTAMTTFLKGLSSVMEWLTKPLEVFGVPVMLGNFAVTPLALFGSLFVIVIGYVILRSLTF